ncbi:MAG: hypothetical protein MUF31_15490 [Akkermansiaceae bacterium]|jgi:hypothetical protein|nr:hypothetical protein [Akkermansiaceae bacterium]
MSDIVISGCGVVSPAGWGLGALRAFLDSSELLETSWIERQDANGAVVKSAVARVPEPVDRGVVPKSPRLRRASPVGRYAAAAMAEALGPEKIAGAGRLGVICATMNGCVNYSNRFFAEVLADPSVASPILFPETVYNAPSSHLSAVTASTAPNDTLIGDGAGIFIALDLAAEWLERGDADAVLVVAPEEVDWLSAEGLGYYSSSIIPSEGAAAFLLEKGVGGVRLETVPDVVSYALVPDRKKALCQLWEELGVRDDGRTLWVDGRCGVPRFDDAESAISWSGPRISPRLRLGEAMGASAGFQLAVAVDALQRGLYESAVVTAVGGNQGVGGGVLGKAEKLKG